MSGYEYATDRDVKRFFDLEPPEPAARFVGNTAYVMTVADALRVSDYPGVDFVVIEDNAERAKLNRLAKALNTR